MNKKELARGVAKKLSVSITQSNKLVMALQEVIIEELQRKGTVKFHGFGMFIPWVQAKRMGRNPRNGQLYIIESRVSVKFKPGKDLLKKLNSSHEKPSDE